MEDVKHSEFYEGFNQTFAEWEPAPAKGVWNKIEARLDDDRPRPVLWWWLGSIALILTLAGVGYFKSVSNSNNQLVNIRSTNIISSAKHQNASTQPKEDVNEKKQNTANVTVTDNKVKATSPSAKQKDLVNNESKSTTLKAIAKTPTTFIASKPKTAYAVKKDINKNTNTTEALQNNAVSQNNLSAIKADNKGNGLKTDSNLKAPENKVSSNAGNTIPLKQSQKMPGNTGVDSSFTVSKRPKPSSAELSKVESDSSGTNKQTRNVKPQITQTDSVKIKIDSAAELKKPVTDSIKKSALTQTKDSIKPILPKISIFSISAFVSPEQAGQVIMQNNSAFNVSGETSNLHIIYGLRAAISLNKKLEVSLAFSYSNFNVNFPSTQVIFSRYITQPYVFNSSYGDMSVPAATMLQSFSVNAPPFITSFKMNYQYAQTIQFMNVPVCIRLNLGKGKLKPYVTAGANIQYTVGMNTELDLLKENETDVLNYTNLNTRKINIAPTASVGMEYDATRHLGFFLEPNARYNLLSSSTSSTIKSSTYFLGCLGGLRLNL